MIRKDVAAVKKTVKKAAKAVRKATGTAKRKTGARALRAIIENIMLEVMYEVPSSVDVKKVVVPEGILTAKAEPMLLTAEQVKEAS